MAKARELRRRIKSVENTRQITKTMEMVSTSKLKRARDRVVAARPYAQALSNVIGSLYDPGLAERFPLLRQPAEGPGRVALVFITSNRGLCGGFNANLIRKAMNRAIELRAQQHDVELHAIGRKGIGFFRYVGETLTLAREDIGDRPTAEHAASVMGPLIERFVRGEIDAVDVVFATFNNPLSTPPTLLPVLPIQAPADGQTGGQAVPNYILKPSAEAILKVVLPMYVQNQMYRALVETAASEQGREASKKGFDVGPIFPQSSLERGDDGRPTTLRDSLSPRPREARRRPR